MGEIRFVGTGETRGYPYLVCKKTVVVTLLWALVLTGPHFKVLRLKLFLYDGKGAVRQANLYMNRSCYSKN